MSSQPKEEINNEEISMKIDDDDNDEITMKIDDDDNEEISMKIDDDDNDEITNDNYDVLNVSHQVYSYHKKILYKELNKKQEKLSIKIEILRFKYAEYKKWSDFFNLMIIVLSSSITLLQSVNAEMRINDIFFILSPIFISTSIALLAAIIRFKKWVSVLEEFK